MVAQTEATEGCAFLSHSLGAWAKVPAPFPQPQCCALACSQPERRSVGFYFLGNLKKIMATVETLLQALFPHAP